MSFNTVYYLIFYAESIKNMLHVTFLKVQKLEPKKMGIWLRQLDKTQIFSNLWLSTFQKSIMSCPNRQLLVKNGGILPKINFEYFQIHNDCYKQSGISRWKNEVIYLVFMFPSWFMVLHLSDGIVYYTMT